MEAGPEDVELKVLPMSDRLQLVAAVMNRLLAESATSKAYRAIGNRKLAIEERPWQ